MFGKRIVELRKQHGWTQEKLAKDLGISRSALSLYEIEKREPDIETLKELAFLFEVPVGYILGNEQKKFNSMYTMDTQEFIHNFKIRICNLMDEQKISENEFIKKTNFNKDESDAYLYGNKMPSIENLVKIAQVLNVSVDYLLNNSQRKHILPEEEMLLQKFERCDDECKQYLLAKAGVLCVEGISAVATGEYGKYLDKEKKSFSSNGTEEMGA